MRQELICVSIGKSSFTEINGILKEVNFAEIRLDLSMLADDEIISIFACGKPLIATCREGIFGRNERLDKLLKAIRAGAAYVDVETESDGDFIKTVEQQAKNNNCKFIVSFHDFEKTPTVEEMVKTVEKCKAQGAEIVKLVTTANTVSDAARVLSLYGLFPDGDLLAFAMGDKGLITRVTCVSLGAPYTYAAVSAEKPVAGGQISFAKMKNIMDNLTL